MHTDRTYDSLAFKVTKYYNKLSFYCAIIN